MSESTKSSRTSQKLRQTNENIVIGEIRSLNTRVAQLLEQFSLLTMEIGNVADDLEQQQVGTNTVRVEFKEIKAHFTELTEALENMQKKVGILERKLTDMERRSLNFDTTYYNNTDEDGGKEDNEGDEGDNNDTA